MNPEHYSYQEGEARPSQVQYYRTTGGVQENPQASYYGVRSSNVVRQDYPINQPIRQQQIVYVQPQSRVIEEPSRLVQTRSVGGSRMVREVVEPRIIEETRVIRPRIEESQRVSEVIREYQREPEVQVVQQSRWQGYYSGKDEYRVPPPKAMEEKSKSCCSPLLLGLLGLLALAGLITALVLALNTDTGYGSKVSGGGKVEGISEEYNGKKNLYSGYSITKQTTVLQNTGTSETSTEQKSNELTNKTQNSNEIEVAPVPVNPNQNQADTLNRQQAQRTSSSSISESSTIPKSKQNSTNTTAAPMVEIDPIVSKPVSSTLVSEQASGSSAETATTRPEEKQVDAVAVDPVPIHQLRVQRANQ